MEKHYLNYSLISIEGEVWKDVNGWEDLYCVSSFGRFKRKDRYVYNYRKGYALLKEKILKQNIQRGGGHKVLRDGYLHVCLYRSLEEQSRISLQRLVAINFIPNPENKRIVNHIDCNTMNNHYLNLEWATDSENQFHAVLNNLRDNTLGEKSNFSKLTNEQVLNIRKLGQNKVRAVEIAEEFKITDKTVREILRRKTWKHL